ncbi:MAG: HAMP domain-containing sensor histidine kinase [Woeseiaceae bacterium]|nr:HAMP domain-containing sensor histidine kinase [Woeseiaceae bacterium]
MSSSFRGKLFVAGGVLMLTIGALATLVYVSTERYQYHLERSVIANQVLSGFQSISDHTYRKLNAVGQIVATGDVGDVDARLANERQLATALATTRGDLETERSFESEADMSAKLDRLNRIEAIVERIIDGGAEIRAAVESSDRLRARAELESLQGGEIAGRFNDLIDEALAAERTIVTATQADAIALSEAIDRFLPVAILVTILIGSFVATAIFKSLRLSLTQLRAAADAYTAGDLEHRSFHLPDVEFDQLGAAFNRMAVELAARRSEARQSQQDLEREVQQRTQELSQTLKRLENADASRRRFLADISHELRTPLTLIQGEAEMVMRGAEKAPDEYREALIRVRDQAIHTTHLVKDLLLVARAEEGNLNMERRTLDFAELVRDVNSDFRSAALKKKLSLLTDLPEQPVLVSGDPFRLRQVLGIVMDNAIRYSNDGQDVSFRLVNNGRSAQASVRNRGARLDKDEVNNVFDRFFRGNEAARSSDGSGLGLPVAKAIVEAHGGTISLQGEDEGVTAIIQLPLLEPEEDVA